MLKLPSKNFSVIFLTSILTVLTNGRFFSIEKAEAYFTPGHEATIQSFINENEVVARANSSTNGTANWIIGETLSVVSQNQQLGVIAFVELISVTSLPDGKYELRLALKRQSRKYFVLVGDIIKRLDLSTENSQYVGSTELLIENPQAKNQAKDQTKSYVKKQLDISARYRPLVHQGFIVGDTAQTLYEKEFLLNYFGNIYYGYNDWLTFGTLAPVNAFGRPNANFRAKLFNGEVTTLTTGLSFVRLSQEDEASLNLNFYWDALSTEALISHTFLSLGLINWTNSEEAAALKYLTSSSFQTGYEIILDNWDRFLIGPSYNFEKKALGGYLSYIWIMDRLHMQASVNATDVTHLRLDPTDGYYGFFDLFWRF